ncbi:restriction endonuclease subunit S [Escherichia coli]|uniref:restriction endonuclease subunit S n=1 Tax=Escherichia coli TaxID=562 RepID=UPI003C2BE970
MSELSYLEKLLDGVEVEWLPLTSLCKLITTGKLNANAMEDNGIYPFFTCNEEPYQINTYAFDMEAILISGNGSQVGHLNYYNGKFNAYQRTYILGEFESNIIIMYLYHYLKKTLKKYIHKNSKKGSVPYITMPMLENFIFPIPCPDNPAKSLAIQSEIVRILDKFSELTAELTAELSMRKKQYNYYRDQLLSFKEGEVEWKTLGEIGHFTRGKRFVKTDMLSEGYPCIHYGEMYTYYNVWTNKTKSFVSQELASKLRVSEYGDVIIVAAGETIEDIGKGTAWLGKSNVVFHDACFSYRCLLNPKYIAYFTRTKIFHDQIKKHISSGKISAINANGLSKVKIPMLSAKEQARIVEILDKFDTLTNSITEGLPREIELRQKQYEYYRDLLFSFPKPETISN